MRLKYITFLASLWAALFLVDGLSTSWAQSAKLQTAQRPPYYAGVPLELQVIAEGFKESPQPEIQFNQPEGASLNLVGVSPSVSSSIQIINGRMTQSRSVVYNYRLNFLASKVGRYQVGPIRLTQGNAEKKIAAVSIEVTNVPAATNQKLKLIIPDSNIYIGQRIPIRLEWWVEADGVENLISQQANVPLFDQQDDFQFYDQEKDSDNKFSVTLKSGQKEFPATVSSNQLDGKSYLVWKVERIMVPLKAGTFDIPSATVNVDEGLRWQSDLFGRRSVTQSRKLRTSSQPVKFRVLSLPTQNRPPSFAGAVGKGFVLEVSADRSVVQAGDPIKLTLKLKGDAEVANASLPVMTGDLPDTDFRLPSGKVAGKYIDGEKQFEIVIRVLSDKVSEIPPISYSWFDPDLKSFQTTQSLPIALSVKGAQMISAQDVVGSSKDSQTPPELSNQEEPAASTQTNRNFSLIDADLSINRDLKLLTKSSSGILGSWWQQTFSYGLAMILVFAVTLMRRQSEIDPQITAKLNELKLQREVINKANSVEELSNALRRVASITEIISRKEFESLLADCDTLQYAREKNISNKLDVELRNRGLTIVDEILDRPN